MRLALALPAQQATATRQLRIDRQVIASDPARDRFSHRLIRLASSAERIAHRDMGCVLPGEHNPPVDLAQVVIVLPPNSSVQ